LQAEVKIQNRNQEKSSNTSETNTTKQYNDENTIRFSENL